MYTTAHHISTAQHISFYLNNFQLNTDSPTKFSGFYRKIT